MRSLLLKDLCAGLVVQDGEYKQLQIKVGINSWPYGPLLRKPDVRVFLTSRATVSKCPLSQQLSIRVRQPQQRARPPKPQPGISSSQSPLCQVLVPGLIPSSVPSHLHNCVSLSQVFLGLWLDYHDPEPQPLGSVQLVWERSESLKEILAHILQSPSALFLARGLWPWPYQSLVWQSLYLPPGL